MSRIYLLFILFSCSFITRGNALMTSQRKLELRDLVKKTWYHGFENYMQHAFPDDELLPISCRGIGYDHTNHENHERNDVLGDFSMTLIDAIDTFIALQDYKNFELALRKIIKTIPNFNLNSKVQVFETTIRVLGGLLSGHLFAKDPLKFFKMSNHNNLDFDGEIPMLEDYNDELLILAKDLADRMLPAFDASNTGIPYARINLRHGVMRGEETQTCTAGAGSLLLEFATLSRLIGDSKYENVAKKAFYALWERRSKLNLLGNTIDVQTGDWSYEVSSIGAGIDSFYEYILKSHILLQDDSFLDLWNQAYEPVMTYMKSADGFWHRGVNMYTGAVAATTIDSLAAFWPGLQVLAGDIESAIKSHMTYANLWARYSGIPEVFNMHQRQATALAYPLRPEFIESNYFLYRATKDEYYLNVAERVIMDLVDRTWVKCGLASIENLHTGRLDDRMHSFMLSETLKYLYLTFDESNPINHLDEPFIFTTEGHILYIPNAQDFPENQRSSKLTDWQERESLDSDQLAKEESKAETVRDKKNDNISNKPETCEVFPSLLGTKNSKYSSQLKLSVTGRTDFEYAKLITGSHHLTINHKLKLNQTQRVSPSNGDLDHSQPRFDDSWFEFGLCEVPSVNDELIQLSFSRSHEDVDRGSMSDQVEFFHVPIKGDERTEHHENQKSVALVKNLTDLSFSLKKLHDGHSYEIVKIGRNSLPRKTTVVLSDPYAMKVLKPQKPSEKLSERDRDHLTAIRVSYEDLGIVDLEESRRNHVIEKLVMVATFGPDVRIPGSSDLSVGNPPIELVQLSQSNEFGCLPIDQLSVNGKVVLTKRGECTFASKLENAVLAHAKGVIIVNEDESLIIPTSDRIEARDERENLVKKDGIGNQKVDKEHQNKLKSIPLLFANFESGQLLKKLLDQKVKLSVQIGENPLELLDSNVSGDPLHLQESGPDQGLPQSSSDGQPQNIVINGYRLSNLLLANERLPIPV